MTALRELIEGASDACEHIFASSGKLLPFWHCETRAGELNLVPAPPGCSKDAAAALLRAFMEHKDVIRCCFITEAWAVKETNLAALPPGGDLSTDPRRQEIVAFLAEDAEGGALIGMRAIIREGPPRLGPLEISEVPDEIRGRFAGMLPRRGRTLQ